LEIIRCHFKAFHREDIPVAGDILLKSAERENSGLPLERLLLQAGCFSVLIIAAALLTNLRVQSWRKFLTACLDFIDFNVQSFLNLKMDLLLWRYSEPAWTRSCAACSR